MKASSKKKLRAYLIGGLGVTFILVGVITAKQILSKTIEGVKEKLCVDSPSHKEYKGWVQEVGPYIYIFGTEKIDVVFSSTTFKYKSIKQIEFDPEATKKECSLCSEHDLLTVINLGYIATMANSNGDVSLALGLLPTAVSLMLDHADNVTGSRDTALKNLGLNNLNTFPDHYPLFPAGWIPDFGFHTKENHTSIEMKALYHVLQNATLLGVAKPPPSFCKSQPLNSSCLQSGFLPLADSLIARQKELVASNSNFTDDSIFTTIFETIRVLFCPNVTTHCLDVSKKDMIRKISTYVTEHLVKFTMHIFFDSQNSEIVTTRKQSELSVGYYMKHIRLPSFPDGIPVPGLIGNDSDRIKAKEKKFQEYSKCDVAGTGSHSWISYDGFTSIPSHLFLNATSEFRRIKGRLYEFAQGNLDSLTFCKKEQDSGVVERHIFDTMYYASIKLNRVGKGSVNSVYTEVFELDLDHLYGVNNISTFVNGLFDASNPYQSPLLISAPHFFGSDGNLAGRFNMAPTRDKHLSTYNIEPATGLVLSSNKRLQFNTVLTKNIISAARSIPLNISYYNSDNSRHTSYPIPIAWADISVVLPEKDTQKLKIILTMVNGSCISIILGPLLGILFFIISIILFLKAVKVAASIHDVEEYKE